ncbi:MAG: DUF29 domain-containing protein [Okeania sp. SIO2D1]|nr:DUF29 domain-containing protein [Okeania sp. SIO2D1]
MTVKSNLISLYENEYEQWLVETINLLKENRFNELDKEHLIEELEELSLREKKTVERFLEQIIRHLLLLQYWTVEYEYNFNHWLAEIMSFRTQINEDLTQNLRNYLQENQAKVYEKALKYVRQKTGDEIIFPANCPYSLEQLLDMSWLPFLGGENSNNQVIIQSPYSPESEKLGVEELLTQLKEAIASESNLSEDDKETALEELEELAQAANNPGDGGMKKVAKRAIQMLTGIFSGLPAVAKLAETAKGTLPALVSMFGLE